MHGKGDAECVETLEKSRVCRLCGQQSGIAVDIFDKNEQHVRKINAILPILVHEMDLLPKQMCHRCSYKLEEFFKFYVECAKTDGKLKKKLSWMSEEGVEKNNSTPMVKMNKFKIKTEPLDNDSVDPHNDFRKFSEVIFPVSILQHGANQNLTLPCLQCKCVCSKSVRLNKTSSKKVIVDSKSESEIKAHKSLIIGNEPCVLIEPMSVEHNIKYTKNLFKESKFNPIKSQENSTSNFQTDVFHGLDVDNDSLNSKKLNRSLRPRRSSIDYVGPKKKVPINFKMKIKDKFDDIDMSLVNPIDIRLTQGNSNHPSPIIKLEKVDDPVKSLKTQKNLELFNKRVKELQRKKNSYKKENRNRRTYWTEASQKNKNEKLKVENLNGPTTKKSLKEEISVKKHLKIEKHEIKCQQPSENIINGECTTDNHVYSPSVDVGIVDTKIKQEQDINTITNDHDSEHSVQESYKKPIDRLPFCSLVKLENDYTCNVDYPKIQIRRHSTVTNSLDYEDVGSKVPAKQKIHPTPIPDKKSSIIKDDFCLNNVISTERKMKRKSNNHQTRSWKKNVKEFHFNKKTVKRTVLNKELPRGSNQSELKYFCEECNTSFGNRELYQLHPCYQK